MQPSYLPWLGLIDRIQRSDLHVVLDVVRLSHGDFSARNRVRTRDGWRWLTVPVFARGEHADKALREIVIDNRGSWREKHLRTIEHAYARAPFFAAWHARLRELFATPWERLIDATDATTAFTLHAFDVRTPLVAASVLEPIGSKSGLILDICRRAGASTYLSGPMGRDYLDEPAFARAGIAIAYHDFPHPTYRQAQPGPFVPALAAIDLLLNEGPNAAHVALGRRETTETCS